jgi:epoxyqueuosine reductase
VEREQLLQALRESELNVTATDVIRIAHECGFELAGIASAGPVADYSRYQTWIEQGYAGEMRYLTDRRAGVRADVRNLLPSARSVICVGKRYNTSYEPQPGGRISRYAAGPDYHNVLKERLERVVQKLLATEQFEYKIGVDTAPLLERSLAREAGLGWIGKNTCLINEPQGSWFFLGEIATSLELAPGVPQPDRCGSCTRCIEACPTQALVPHGEEWTLDSRRCISYLTIELRGPIPEQMHAGIGDRVFGCDICQEVCPWNSRAPLTDDAAFLSIVSGRLEDWAALGKAEFARTFGATPVLRAQHEGFQRNAEIVLKNRTSS